MPHFRMPKTTLPADGSVLARTVGKAHRRAPLRAERVRMKNSTSPVPPQAAEVDAPPPDALEARALGMASAIASIEGAAEPLTAETLREIYTQGWIAGYAAGYRAARQHHGKHPHLKHRESPRLYHGVFAELHQPHDGW